MKETASKKEQAHERRQALKGLCNTLKTMQDTGQLTSDDGTMNGLLRAFYAQNGHTDLKTYEQWKKEGYQVKRGEKAILFWAKPKATKDSKANAIAAGKPEDEAEKDYFPVKYLFSNKQVHQVPNN